MTNKKIGILTSGGDCSGLNTVIWAVTLAATSRGWEVYGIENATDGLMCRPMRYKKLTMTSFDCPYARLGGTMLGTNNSGTRNMLKQADGSYEPISDEEIIKRIKEGVDELGLEALVVIGGDGSMAIVSEYCKKAGVKMIGIPKTIDNDAPVSDIAVGFATARNIVMHALDEIISTAISHERTMIVEVMGREAGHLALEGAIAGLADICLIPEVPYTYEGVLAKLRSMRRSGKRYGLFVIAEGIKTPEGQHAFSANGYTFGGVSHYFVDKLSKEPEKFNVRATILGHVQRGGSPVAEDRILASAFGVHAVELLEKGATNRFVLSKDGKVCDMDLAEAIALPHHIVDPKGAMVEVARGLGMYVGE